MFESISLQVKCLIKMDRLSNLPDEILCHILYFLTTKEAALTSVLSKRWRNLLAYVPYLEIDDSIYLHPEEGKREKRVILQSFMDFVDRLLALQGDSPIKKFSLKVKTGVDPERVDRWIRNVLGRGVSHLDLCLEFGEEYSLPYQISVSMTLVELKTGRVIDTFAWNNDMYLPMLKTLFLDSIVSLGGQIQKLLSACPALEELYMIKTRWNDTTVTLSSPILKKLTIKLKDCSESVILKSLSLDAPSLVHFDYTDTLAEDYPQVNLRSLRSAIINLSVDEDQIKQARSIPSNDLLEDDTFPGLNNAWKLISGLRNVHKLWFTSDIFEVMSLHTESIPVFSNLRMLVIRSDVNRGWQAMPILLQNSPHLEYLIFEGLLHYVTDKCGDACICISQKEKGRSLKSCPVKKLGIKGFQGTMREIEMIRHFLDCFPCLEEIKILAEENCPSLFKYPGMLELVQKIMNLYNELSTCNVQFLVHGSL